MACERMIHGRSPLNQRASTRSACAWVAAAVNLSCCSCTCNAHGPGQGRSPASGMHARIRGSSRHRHPLSRLHKERHGAQLHNQRLHTPACQRRRSGPRRTRVLHLPPGSQCCQMPSPSTRAPGASKNSCLFQDKKTVQDDEQAHSTAVRHVSIRGIQTTWSLPKAVLSLACQSSARR